MGHRSNRPDRPGIPPPARCTVDTPESIADETAALVKLARTPPGHRWPQPLPKATPHILRAATGISVFLDDRASFDKAVPIWRKRVPAFIYLTSDGSLPKTAAGSSKDTGEEPIDYWQGQFMFVDGLAQETCRDFGHTGWDFAAAAHVAETARIQGLDLYFLCSLGGAVVGVDVSVSGRGWRAWHPSGFCGRLGMLVVPLCTPRLRAWLR